MAETSRNARAKRAAKADDRDDAEDPSRRLSISLTGRALSDVEGIAGLHGISAGEAVRRAISLLKFINDEEADGTTFTMQKAGGEPRPLTIIYL